jgi:hypothetical protein
MTTPCPSARTEQTIPQHCADKFEEIGTRLGRIEAKLDHLCDNQRTWGRRLWDIAKAAVLLLIGWMWGLKR